MALHNLHNDHEIMAQFTFVAYGAHPLFLITLNFMNFLLLGFIVEVRFSGFLVKNKTKQNAQAISMCIALSEARKVV